MSRFESTGPVDVENLQHSVVELPWSVMRGARGASDGSAGPHSNVPSALAVLRHAQLYAACPEEIDEAFHVLEHHVIDETAAYPVAITVLPFLFDTVRRGSPIARRITGVIAKCARLASTLEAPLAERMHEVIASHERDIASWIGRTDRAAAALAIHVPALRPMYLRVVSRATELATCHLLALAELGESLPRATKLALRLLDSVTAEQVKPSEPLREERGERLRTMVAAAYLARFGANTPELCTRIDAALPPSAPGALERYVDELWRPTIVRPTVAPKLHEARVVFRGEKLVLVRAGSYSVTLPWHDAPIQRGQTINVGITVHGQAKLAIVTEGDGNVTVKHFT